MTTETNEVVAAIAKPSKMELSKTIFAEVMANKALATPRKEFITRAMSEAGATKKGASTYFQMLKKQALTGGKLYTNYSKKKPVEVIARPE